VSGVEQAEVLHTTVICIAMGVRAKQHAYAAGGLLTLACGEIRRWAELLTWYWAELSVSIEFNAFLLKEARS